MKRNPLIEIIQGDITRLQVDAVVNAQLPSAKPVSAPLPEPTGINFVELLEQKHQQAEPAKDCSQEKEHEGDKNKE